MNESTVSRIAEPAEVLGVCCGLRVLLFEPDHRIVEVVSRTFRRFGWLVVQGVVGLSESCSPSPNLVVLALAESATPSLDVLRRIRESYPEARIIVTMAYVSTPAIVEVMRLGAYDCLVKPFVPEELLAAALGTKGNLQSSSLPSLARIEWEYMHRILSIQAGNISQSARILGIRRTTLQRKLKKYPPNR